jgi:4-diphosphocytidyl-2-C-methyl-D-erythritol kinase
MKTKLSFKSYAKINLSLDVKGVLENGYHEVAMVMQGINLYDEMTVRIFPAEKHIVTLKTNRYYVPTDARNTAFKAAQLIIDRYNPEPMEIRIDIKKNIPVAAGLAGGSSNAAGVLLALNSMLELGMKIDDLCELGEKIGADVPFCIMTMAAVEPAFGISGGTTCALAEGIGERLTPLPAPKFWTVLAKPHADVSTPAVYKALDAADDYPHPDTPLVIQGIRQSSLGMIKSGMANSLEAVTLRDVTEVSELKRMMQKAAGDKSPVMMSGSGPTVYALFNRKKNAKIAETLLKRMVNDKKTEIFCVKTL